MHSAWPIAIAASLLLSACAAEPEPAAVAEAPPRVEVEASAPPVSEVPAPEAPSPADTTPSARAALAVAAVPERLPDAPADFALSVSVLSPQGLRTAHLPPEQRAARYIVDADWILRAQVGLQLPRAQWSRTGGAERTLPGQTRQLTRMQAARLWWLLNQSGAVGAAARHASPPPELYQPARDRLVYIVSYAGDGHASWAVLDDRELATAPAAPLVHELAALAYQE